MSRSPESGPRTPRTHVQPHVPFPQHTEPSGQFGQQYPPPGYPPQHQYTPPRRKRRVFLWVFLAIQALFLIWIIAGAAGTSHSGTGAHVQALTWCADKANWQYLYKSQADCVTHYGNGLNAASDVGKSLGIGIIIALWVVVDFFLGLGYGIYRLASRR